MIKRIGWDEAREHFQSFENKDYLKWGVTQQGFEAYNLDDELYLISRPSVCMEGKPQAHIIAVSGKHLNQKLPSVFDILKSKGFESVRFHCHATDEARVARLVRCFGIRPIEIIYQKEL